MQGEGPTFRINESFGSSGKTFSINFSKADTKVCLMIVVICLLMKKKSSNVMLSRKMLTLQFNFVSEVYIMHLGLLT